MDLPPSLPIDPDRFYRSDIPLDPDLLHESTPPPPSALDRLGASPLPKTGFPFIGFLSGVYDHVSSVARGEAPIQP